MCKIRLASVILINLLVFAIVIYSPGALQTYVNTRLGGNPLDHPIWIPAAIVGLIIFFTTLVYTIGWYVKKKR